MKKYKLHEGRPPLSLGYTSLEDMEGNIGKLKTYLPEIKPVQGIGIEDQYLRIARLDGIPALQKQHNSAKVNRYNENDDLSVAYAKAKILIDDITGELLQDYFTNVSRLKVGKETKRIMNEHKHESPSVKSGQSDANSDQLPGSYYSGYNVRDPYHIYDNTASEYNEQLQGGIPYSVYQKQLTDKAASKYDGHLQGDKIAPSSHEQLQGNVVPEYHKQLQDDTMPLHFPPHLRNNKAHINYKGKLGIRNKDEHQKNSNSFESDIKSVEYIRKPASDFVAKAQGQASGSAAFDNRKPQQANLNLLHQLQMEIASLFKNKGETVTTDTLKSNEIWLESTTSTTTEIGNVGNDLNKNRKPNVFEKHNNEITLNKPPSIIDKFNIDKNSFNKKQNTLQDKFMIRLDTNPNAIRFDEQYASSNKPIQNHNENQVHNSNSSFYNNRLTSVLPHEKQTDVEQHVNDKNGSSLSNDHKNVVSLEKRRGNMAGKYRDKNKKKGHKYQPKPQAARPQQAQQVVTQGSITVQQTTTSEGIVPLTVTTTVEETTTSKNILSPEGAAVAVKETTKSKGILSKVTTTAKLTTRGGDIFSSIQPTQPQTSRIMYEIIDRGEDNIDIPLSGPSSWKTRIHGRRDIVLGGAVIGGIGIMLIILSMIYVFINRRSGQKKSKTKKKKPYKGTGSADEKARLTQSNNNLFSLSSDEDTTDDSEQDNAKSKHSQAKTKKKRNY